MTRPSITNLLCIALAAMPAHADTISISGTKVTIREGDSPVVAVIEMSNDLSNGYGDGLVADDLIVTPPDGTYCDPVDCVLRVEEGDTGTLRLMEWVGG